MSVSRCSIPEKSGVRSASETAFRDDGKLGQAGVDLGDAGLALPPRLGELLGERLQLAFDAPERGRVGQLRRQRIEPLGERQDLLADARHVVVGRGRLELAAQGLHAVGKVVGGGDARHQPLDAVEALQDGALVFAHGVEAGDLELHVAELFGQSRQAVLQLAQPVAGHVAGGVELGFHLVQAAADVLDGAGDGAAVAADVVDLAQDPQKLLAQRLDLVFAEFALQRLDALLQRNKLPLHLGLLGLPPRLGFDGGGGLAGDLLGLAALRLRLLSAWRASPARPGGCLGRGRSFGAARASSASRRSASASAWRRASACSA